MPVSTDSAGALLAGAARTATTASPDQTNYRSKGVAVWLNVTAAGTPAVDTLTLEIQAKDPVSGTYTTIAASTAISAVGSRYLRVYPGIELVANQKISDVLPRDWRAQVVHVTSVALTYSVGHSLIP